MNKLALGALILAGTCASASVCYAGGNPLFGTWKYSGKGYVDRDGHDWCAPIVGYRFGPQTLTTFSTADGSAAVSQHTQSVSYLPNGKQIYVSSTQSYGSGMYYIFLSRNQIETDNIGHCIFNRQ